MIIKCESCGTRFNLADGQIPPQGARVRCSKCHHRFFVLASGEIAGADEVPPTPPPPEPTPEPEPTRAREPGPAPAAKPARRPAAPAAAPRADDPDLDNPEFLFDGPEGDEAGLAEGAVMADDAAVADAEPIDASPLAELGDASFALDEPEEADVLGDVDAADVREQVFGLEDGGSENPAAANEDPMSSFFGDAGADPEMSVTGLADPDDASPDPFGSWDDISSSGSSALFGESPGSGPLGSFDEDGAPSEESARSAAASEAASPDVLREPELSFEPVASHTGARAVRAAAILVGLLLVLGGLRLLVLHGTGIPPGPETVAGAGWVASEIEALHLEDDTGRRVLVLRGRLDARGSDRAPRVWATLLDSGGRPLEARPVAVLQRLDGDDLGPDALGAALAAAAPPRAAGVATRGFTLLIADPPQTARRFRLELSPGGRG